MPRKMARQTLERHAGALLCRKSPLSRVGTSRQSRKSLQFAPLPSSSGESRVISLLNDISRSAKDLRSGLTELQTYSQALGDPTAPLEKPHLRYVDQLISQAAAGEPAAEVKKDPKYMLWVFS